MATKGGSNARATSGGRKSHDLLSWEEAAAYIGPSVTVRWLKRQVYHFKTIKAVPVGGNGRAGKVLISRAELDRYVYDRQLAAEAE